MSAETLRRWVRQSDVDAGEAPGVSSESAREIRELKRRCVERQRTIEVLQRLGVPVARCTIERRTRNNGWRGVMRTKKVRTPIADPAADRAPGPGEPTLHGRAS
jgi:transposase-like protein